MPLVAHVRLREPQRPVALFDLLLRFRQVGDVPEHRHHVGALPLLLGARAEQLEHEVRAFERIDEQQLSTRRLRSDCSSTAVVDSAAEKSMLFSPTARRHPSLASSGAEKSFSARVFAMSSRPSVSVRRIGSVTALMML